MLNDNGFQRPTYDELVQDLISKWQELFGDNANTATNSVGGIFIRVIAYFLNRMYALAEKVYNSQFIDSATGTTLDQLAANLGHTRHAPQAAIGNIVIYGAAGYVVPEGTIFRTSDEMEYITSEPIMLVDTGKNSIDLTTSGHGVITLTDRNIGLGTSTVLYATDMGSKYNKPEDTDKYPAIQVMPVEEVMAVNVGLINAGADLESDDDLRDRLELASQEAPSSPYNGVISAVRNVVGVESVKIVANDTLQTDQEGNPPKTIHIYVDGGEKSEVANAIMNSIAAGIQTFGKVDVEVADIGGTVHHIYFDQPTQIDIFAKIQLQTDDAFPSDGKVQVAQSVIDYVRSVEMGGTVHFSYLYRNLYNNVPGIVVANVSIGKNKTDLSMQDIPLTSVQRAATQFENIEVS